MFNFFKKKNKPNQSKSERYFNLKIREVKKETNDANTLIFEKPENPIHYLPGQFITLILSINEKEVRRSYSLSSSPFSDEFPAITVKRVELGVVSNYLNDHMKKGDVLNVMEAAGHFVPNLQKDQSKAYILLAAGSGVTPLLSIIKSILHIEKESTINLIYQNRNENSIIFKKDLDKLKSIYKERFLVVDVVSQPSGSWTGYNGRINAEMLKDILLDSDSNDLPQAEYFICGPSGFMQTIQAFLKEFRIAENHIHKESFYSGEPNTSKTPKKDLNSYDVKILLDGKEYDVAVAPDKTILEAALDMDIDMPFSCQSGLCTACRGKLLNGEVNMEDEDGLSEEEIKDGYILNCVSKPKGPGVKIEVG